MKRLLSAVSVAAFLVGAMVGPASAARPDVAATINGGGTSTMAGVFGIANPGSSVFGFTVKLMSDGSATGHIMCLDQHGDAPDFPGIIFGEVEVTVDSDDRGLLGIEEDVPAGPLSGRVSVRLTAAGVEPTTLEEIAHWGVKHCPVCDAIERAVPVTTHVSTESPASLPAGEAPGQSE